MNPDAKTVDAQLNVKFKIARASCNLHVEFIGERGIGVITGPSGSGKTTIFDCLAGLLTPNSGEIRLGGKTFFDAEQKINLPPQDRGIGYVLQRPSLFPHMTVRQNIKYAMKREQAEQIEKRISDLAGEFAIEGLLDRRPDEISGGQAQRVALVRAIAARPELYLLDEPFSNLDDQGRNEMIEAIKELRRITGKPILYITHSRSEAVELADYRITVTDGEFRRE